MVLLAVAAGCHSQLETQARMFRHFGQAQRIQAAASFGRLDAAKEAGARIQTEAPTGLPSGTEPFLQAMKRTAARIAEVDEAEELPALSAELADRCGACHETQGGSGPRFGAGMAPDEDDLTGHMAAHTWALDRMWEAVVSRDVELWTAGASALSGRPLESEEFLPRVSDRGTAFLLSSRTHYLAEAAADVEAWEDRTGLLARLSATCLECHQLARLR